ncbi:MAG: SRPBCC domain-containing protein [Hyphomonadaceae bacterium]|nr:SRPBCC domain-containing protein [Hyphomonadaceae bacterium]MBP9235208.1 SRPBCC domain-containing protein [Hyphomonadaceae bacterium]
MHDFRLGGHEHGRFWPVGHPSVFSNDTWHLEITAGQRIVLAYTMGMDGAPMSHSVTVTEFFPDGPNGCRLVFTEQGAYYGGPDDVKNRRGGFEDLLGKLEAELATHA